MFGANTEPVAKGALEKGYKLFEKKILQHRFFPMNFMYS